VRKLLIINPAAGQVLTDFLGNRVDLSRLLSHVDEVTPQTAEETISISEQVAISGSHEIIYVSGGDGTINLVASAIIKATPDLNADQRPAIGIIPTGTCNVLAGELGITDSTITAIIGPRGRRTTRTLDIGKVGDRFFLLMAGFGIDGEAVRNVSVEAKGIFGASVYAVSALAALATHKPSAIKLTIDSETISAKASLILVANAASYGFNQIKIAQEASLDDGWLDICVLEPDAIAPNNLISTVAQAVTSKTFTNPNIRYFRGKSIHIDAKPQMPGQLDGDPVGNTPVHVQLIPSALRFLVPKLVNKNR
jgi:YegS/Rv2252/BmrU family lipid kinase